MWLCSADRQVATHHPRIPQVAVAVCSDSLERRSEHKEQKLMLELELEGAEGFLVGPA